MLSFKISYTLFIYPNEFHFEKLINDCNCGECPNFLKKKGKFFINSGELYYCRIMEKIIKVYDVETAKSCFMAWFQEGENKDETGIYIPEKQKNFYKSPFISLDPNEFPSGFSDLEIQIDNVKISGKSSY